MIRVRETGKGNIMLSKIALKRLHAIGPDGKDFGLLVHKLLIIVPQLIQVRATVWSQEAPQKNENNAFPTPVIAQANRLALVGLKNEIRSLSRNQDFLLIHLEHLTVSL